MTKPHVYIVSTYYPPTVSVASGRIAAMANYLDKSLFDVSVITKSEVTKTDENGGIKRYFFTENSIIKKFNFDEKTNYLQHVIKVIWNKICTIAQLDDHNNWKKKVINLLEYELQKNPKSIVITSFSPEAPHEVAIELKRKGVAFYWLADFRDEMSNNPSKLSNALRKKFIKIEKQIVQYANATSTVSQPLQDNCKLLFNKPSLLIRNGYDFEINKTKHRNEVFTINYVGTFYGKIKPTNFFAALIKCQSKIENIKINFIGRCSNTIIPSVLIDKVQVHGVVDAHTSIAMMQQADVLLLLLNKNKNYRGIYSTKVFEYLGCCRPILALIDKNDVVNELLESCKAAYIADFDDILEIEKQIMLAYNDWKNNIMLPFEYDKIERLHRKYEIEKISVFLNINAR